MAIYHLSTKPVSRGVGRSATAAAAYRSAERVEDLTTGEVFDYTRKRGVEHAEIVLPTSAAKQDINWARDRTQLWNAAERAEKRIDARVAREYELALPHELSKGQRVELVREFATEIANKYGVAVDFAIHKAHREGDERNSHAHVLTTTRSITATGLGAKTDIELGDRDRAKKGLGRAAEEVKSIRGRWAELTNEHLQRHGIEARVDHRSLQEQGIERLPTTHVGPAVSGMERRGIGTEVGNRIREEQRLDMQRRLEAAAELGRLEREKRQLSQSILVLDTDLAAAKSERDRVPEKVVPARGRFEGLTLGGGSIAAGRGEPERSRAPASPLRQAVDRYARAWLEAVQMKQNDLPILAHQRIAVEEAGAALDQVRPHAAADLRNALTHEPTAARAMKELQGEPRISALLAGIEHETTVRTTPALRAQRLVGQWYQLEAKHEATRDWRHEVEHEKVKGQMKDLALEFKRDPQLESLLRNRQREYGISPGSRLDDVLRERDLQRALDISVMERGRHLGLSL